MTDRTLRILFETARLPAARFNHETHVRVAWIYVKAHDLNTAIELYCRDLRNYANSLDVPTKYHETITWFFMIVVANRITEQPEGDWDTFRDTNPDLVTSASTLLAQHYSREVLRSDEARTRFVLPDRKPFEVTPEGILP